MSDCVCLGELEHGKQGLVKLMQETNFGRIQVAVRDGVPVLETRPRVTRDIKIGGENGARREKYLTDFVLKKEQVEALNHIAGVGCGTVTIQVKHGLPFRMEIEEDAA
jgi:hypothetical protein